MDTIFPDKEISPLGRPIANGHAELIVATFQFHANDGERRSNVTRRDVKRLSHQRSADLGFHLTQFRRITHAKVRIEGARRRWTWDLEQ